ncbi:MAG TPA: hypothetical protein VGN63_12235 [Flavisolibacter sp.]|jgi:hypothetical protein|nr:hypothetical protein [Flavisolibacter sp.]
MIPSQELRIGNFVIADEKLQQISMIDQASSLAATTLPGDTQTAKTFPLENIRPVLLTDEILGQCGFLYHDYFKFWQLIESNDGFRSEMDMDRDYTIIDFMRKPIVKELTSLHQLQNIYYMLKGKELRYVAKKKTERVALA